MWQVFILDTSHNHVLKQNGAHHVLLFFEIFLARRKFPETLPAKISHLNSHLAAAGSRTQTARNEDKGGA
jgi:hypothetical protein